MKYSLSIFLLWALLFLPLATPCRNDIKLPRVATPSFRPPDSLARFDFTVYSPSLPDAFLLHEKRKVPLTSIVIIDEQHLPKQIFTLPYRIPSGYFSVTLTTGQASFWTLSPSGKLDARTLSFPVPR